MKVRINMLVAVLIIFLTLTGIEAAEKAPQKVFDLAKNTFMQWSNDTIIVNAIKTENSKGKTLQQIKNMDKKWQSTPGVADFMKVLIDSECGKYLKEIQKKYPYIEEIIVMDKMGANVAITEKTSDYWQGDEDKFIKSFDNGKGNIHISDVNFDTSTQVYMVQVSFPVRDENKIIGAITIGVDVDKIQ